MLLTDLSGRTVEVTSAKTRRDLEDLVRLLYFRDLAEMTLWGHVTAIWKDLWRVTAIPSDILTGVLWSAFVCVLLILSPVLFPAAALVRMWCSRREYNRVRRAVDDAAKNL